MIKMRKNSLSASAFAIVIVIIVVTLLALPKAATYFNLKTTKNSKNIVYVYDDEGVGAESLLQTIAMLKRHKGINISKDFAIQTINANEVKNGNWINNAILFVMPGGADLPYVKKLGGLGNEQIKRYVMEGGSYLGICAGSYYASSYVEFDKDGALEVLGERELKFFEGKAIGPILAPYDYKTQSGSRAAMIKTSLKDVPETAVYYNGGGYFAHPEKFKNTQVIAYYQNNLAAIAQINYGQGNVILSGVHFEYDPKSLDSQDQHLQAIIPTLIKHTESREKLTVALLNRLLSPSASTAGMEQTQ